MDSQDDIYIALNFKRYIVNKIDFKHNPEYRGGKANMDINFGHAIAIKNNEAHITLRCILFSSAKTEEKPFHLEVHMTGLFGFKGELEEEELKRLLRNHGLTVLFPYLRALITNITSSSGFPPIILPIINVNQLTQKQNIRDGREH